MELAHWADHTETRLGLTKRAPVPGAEGTQVLTKLRSARRYVSASDAAADTDRVPLRTLDESSERTTFPS